MALVLFFLESRRHLTSKHLPTLSVTAFHIRSLCFAAKNLCLGLLVYVFVLLFASSQTRGQDLVPPLVDPRTPNMVAVGFGTVSDYLGSDDYFLGPVPLIRYQPPSGNRYILMAGNAVSSNIANHSWLRTGPTGLYRFGRDDVQDEVVRRLPAIGDSLELGWAIGAEWVDARNIARRGRIDVYASHDVTGTHGGTHVGLSATGWVPVPDIGLFGIYGAVLWSDTSYTDTYFSVSPAASSDSGLPVFKAGSGLRDARVALTSIWPVDGHWAIGASVAYMRLLGDAARSPLTSGRGDPNQFLGGIGIGYTW